MSELEYQKTMKVKIHTLEETWFEGEAYSVFAQGENSGIEIFPHHTILISLLSFGPVVVRAEKNHIFFISGGVLEVEQGVVTILADEAHRARELDEVEAQKARQKALDSLMNKNDNINYSEVLKDIAIARQQLLAIRLSHKDEN